MSRARLASPLLLLGSALLGGCTDAPAEEPPPTPPVIPEGCAPGLRADADGCRPAGIAPEGCAEGFVHDDGSCRGEVVGCPAGQMALPGEACRPIADCGDGPWGLIPVDAQTLFVDESADPAVADGTQDAPFVELSDAVVSATPGATIAIAAGSYDAAVATNQPLHLMGRCPELTTLTGSGIRLLTGASGSSVAGVAIQASQMAVEAVNVTDVTVRQVWIHDQEGLGIWLDAPLGGPASITIEDSLIDNVRVVGVIVSGAAVEMRRTVVRHTQQGQNGQDGLGVLVKSDNATLLSSTALIERSAIVGNQEQGVRISGATATITDTLIADTLPNDAGLGHGLAITYKESTGHRAAALVEGSVVANNRGIGIFVGAADAEIRNVTVHGTSADVDGNFGRGIGVEDHTPMGLPTELSTVLVEGCALTANVEEGLVGFGSTVNVVGTLVRDTLVEPNDPYSGGGIRVGGGFTNDALRSALTVTDSVVRNVQLFGIGVWRSDAIVQHSVIEAVKPVDEGLFGDAVASIQGSHVTLVDSSVPDAHRVGLFVAGATADLGQTSILCAEVPLNGEAFQGIEPVVTDLGDNDCGCGEERAACKYQSASLEPPTPPDL